MIKKHKDIKFILTTSPPHSSQLFGCLLSKLWKKPHITDFRDPWTDVYRGHKSKFRIYIEEKMENWVVKNSTFVISSTKSYSELLKNRYSFLKPERFVTIRNCFEDLECKVVKTNNKFVISYLGIFYSQRNPYTFFKALQLWLEKNPDHSQIIQIKIIGSLDRITALKLKEYGLLNNLKVTGRLPFQKAICELRSSDLLLLLMGTGSQTPKGWIPSKLYEYLAAQLPILAILPNGEASEIIKTTRTGYVIHNDEVEEIHKFLDKIIFQNFKRNEYRRDSFYNPRIDQISNYNHINFTQKFSKLFDNLISN